MINLIESYINILSLDKMNSFLKQNDIILNNEESSFLINYMNYISDTKMNILTTYNTLKYPQLDLDYTFYL